MAKTKTDPDAPPAVAGTDQNASKEPKWGTPVPAGPGPLPRVCKELERAGQGQRRYKCRCLNHTPDGGHPTMYVLVPAGGDPEAAAKAHYLTTIGLAQKLDLAKKAGENPEPANVAVTPLPD